MRVSVPYSMRRVLGQPRFRRKIIVPEETSVDVTLHADEIRKLWDERAYKETLRLVRIASKYHLTVPEYDIEAFLGGQPDPNSKWEVAPLRPGNPRLFLKPEARTELQSTIRAYRKERLETWRLWITAIVPSLTGLLGVIVALLAIILGRR